MPARRAVPPSTLYRLMRQAFIARRPHLCEECQVPLPYLIDRPEPSSANWTIGTPRSCSHGCQSLLVEIAAELWPQYDLIDDGSVPHLTRNGATHGKPEDERR